MSDEDRWLHAALARTVWAAAPTARLDYDPDDDTLVVELVDADPVAEVVVQHLLVEFDGDDPGALPTTVVLTGVAAEPASRSVELAREVLGAGIWAAVSALVASGRPRTDLNLDAAAALELRTAWLGLAEVLRGRAEAEQLRWWQEARVIGVELTPGRVVAVLTDRAMAVLDEESVPLDHNHPDAVVEAIAAAVRRLAGRHPHTHAESCPVGVQLGGPVDSVNGVVEYYDKPLRAGDEVWKDVALGELLRRATDRPEVQIFNDAAALAAYEVAVGFGAELPSFAVLMVGPGIGAKLVRRGRIESFPMEIGIFAPASGASFHGVPRRRALSVERRAGVGAIIGAVDALVEGSIDTLAEAAEVADHSQEALQVFAEAGRVIARAMANIQAVVDPEAWAVYGPPELLDASRWSGRSFLTGLRTVHDHLDYNGLHTAWMAPRRLTPQLGAAAAAAALLTREDAGRSRHAADRSGGGYGGDPREP